LDSPAATCYHFAHGMRSIPLYQPNSVPDASHDVRAPGGYEWWYFDAEDPATDTQVVAIFLQGFVFHPGYLRAHAAFLRRPTKRPPVLPIDFPCMYLCVYRNGKILHQFMTQYRPTDYAAATDAVDVAIGPNRLVGRDGVLRLDLSGTPWKLTGHGPKTLTDQSLTAQLVFKPTFTHPPAERVFLSRQMTSAEHYWVIANPRCDVSGTIQLSEKGSTVEQIHFTGRGYHDHNYGTGPLGPGLKRWIWGRAMLEDQVTTFHYAVPRDRSLPDEIHLVRANESSFSELRVDRVDADWRGWSMVGLRYPKRLRFVGAESHGSPLELTNARVIDAAPFYLRLMYDAEVDGRKTTAFCEVAYPHRLRWPVLGRMIEVSIDKRACAPA
jgi:carotenoid 1,2-hydratase